MRVGSALAFRSLLSVLRAALCVIVLRGAPLPLLLVPGPGGPEEGGAGSRSRGKQ